MADILSQDELDALLTQMKPEDGDDAEDGDGAEASDGAVDGGGADVAASGPQESGQAQASFDDDNIQMILNIPLDVRAEIGRTRMYIGEILELCQGSVIELDHMASDMIDLMINDKLIAQGEAVVINENFGLRVLEVDSVGERIRKL